MNLSLSRTTDPRCAKALEFLDVQIRSGVKLGLESTLALLERMGNPHHGIKYVHVAGTNGKGSTSALIAAALTECGFKTGFFSSPHLVNFRERYRVNMRAVSEIELAELIEEMQETAGDMFNQPESPSFFEVSTVLGMMHFCKQKCDIAIMEVGMGGRLDATNVIDPLLSIITRIDFDHVKPLGDTLTAIAGEKAGIIKPGRPVVIGAQPKEAMAVIAAKADELGCSCVVPFKDYKAISFESGEQPLTQDNCIEFNSETRVLTTRFLGPHQLENTATAWAAVNTLTSLGMAIDVEKAAFGMSTVRWPARLDLLDDGTLIDAAHNESGISVLCESLKHYFPEKTWNVMFGALDTKNWRRMLTMLQPYCNSITVTQFEHSRVVQAEELAEFIESSFPDLPCSAEPDTVTAFHRVQAKGDALIVGSLYMAGTVLAEYSQGMPVLLID